MLSPAQAVFVRMPGFLRVIPMPETNVAAGREPSMFAEMLGMINANR